MFLLVNKAKKGDKEAFSKLIKDIRVDLYKISKGFFKNEEDVKDVISETILTAYEKINTLENDKLFKTWIIRILINKCNDTFKKNSKIIFLNNEISEMTHEDDHIEYYDLYNAIKLLNEDIQNIVILYYFNDLSISEISKITNIKEGTIKSRLARGREKLYSILNNEKERHYLNDK
ncbi:sigma-70 family RNA polymerase sigma factor [Clostridium sp. 'White wine YQ']|uniref:sigma-70 family RNA polymerase sigma factor n=1 Tax=Clostridium sp. 'White wine YQ' TaxID=3027474 RepID=UPI002366C622|nr:sigma-70 family RNA polymerase sigma factor [Clostridium sp. 'White wine YQ']MDD7794536.1 sigma-70 family RNA polymerase sigma factor [Clostridium sp. 'White wine YQ']